MYFISVPPWVRRTRDRQIDNSISEKSSPENRVRPLPSSRQGMTRWIRASQGAAPRVSQNSRFPYRFQILGTSRLDLSPVPGSVLPSRLSSLDRTPGFQIDTWFKKNLKSAMGMEAAETVDAVYRSDWGRIVAALIGLVGDFDLAEESAQEAFAAAVDQWRDSGVPEFPRAWIIQTARHKAIDRIRSKVLFAEKLDRYAMAGPGASVVAPEFDPDAIPDDRLGLIFTCCHPALALEAQVALTLRVLGGL